MNHILKPLTLAILLALLQMPILNAQTFTEQTGVTITGVFQGSVNWGDYDNDGYLDILLNGQGGLVIGNYSGIFHNNGDKTFTEQTGIPLTGVSYSNVAWGDYNNDGYLDIALVGEYLNSKIYSNNGNNTFNEQTAMNIPGYCNFSNISWGDYDNDGFPDLLINGYLSGGSYMYTQIYHNNGNNTFTLQKTISIAGVAGKSAWGDYDNDGFLDIILTGSGITKLYHNNGNGNFSEQSSNLQSTRDDGCVVWGDYDNDGFLDILLLNDFRIYHNNGDNTFTEQTNIKLSGAEWVSGGWGDYDNDGWPDILITGKDSTSNYIAKIYRNNHNNTFTEQTNILPKGVYRGSIAWGDYDNDGRLDILLCGFDDTGHSITKLYHNNTPNSNTAPAAPTNLQVVVHGSDVTFTWDKATDAETPQNGLSYNLYVKETGQSTFKRSPQAFTQTSPKNGKRLVAQPGAIQYSANGYTLKGFQSGNYTWSVQAIDAGFMGGPFSTEVSFTVVNVAGVVCNVAAGQLTQTTITMEYSLNSTDGSNGDWVVCTAPTTAVDFAKGGFDVWIRQKSLPANKAKIAIIAPQITPSFSIDFMHETTAQAIADSVEYSVNADMSATTTGTNAKVAVTPGQNLYFRVKATAQKVISAIQTLVVPNRTTPAYTIDYTGETTSEQAPITDEYSINSDMSSAKTGTGVKIAITPGQNLYFRSKASVTAFQSLIQTLVVNNSPALPTAPINNDTQNTFDWTNSPGFTDVASYEFTVDNGTHWATCPNKPVDVGNNNLAIGIVQVRVKATATNFCSTALKSLAAFTINTGINNLTALGITVYPNPVNETLTVDGIKTKKEASIYSFEGKLIKTVILESSENKINVADLPQGIYLLKLTSGEKVGEMKFCKTN